MCYSHKSIVNKCESMNIIPWLSPPPKKKSPSHFRPMKFRRHFLRIDKFTLHNPLFWLFLHLRNEIVFKFHHQQLLIDALKNPLQQNLGNVHSNAFLIHSEQARHPTRLVYACLIHHQCMINTFFRYTHSLWYLFNLQRLSNCTIWWTFSILSMIVAIVGRAEHSSLDKLIRPFKFSCPSFHSSK